MRSEVFLTCLAVTFELGIPVVLLVLLRRVPPLRPKAAAILGAVFPLVLFYIGGAAAYAIDPEDPGYRFNFLAMWEMTAFAYFKCFVGGIVLSFVPWPRALAARFLISAVVVPGLVVAALRFRW